MRKVVVIVGPPERWMPLCREHRQLADFICASPLRAEPNDDSNFSLFLMDLFSGRFDVLVATCPTAIDAVVTMARKRKMLDRAKEAVAKAELIVIGDRTAKSAERNGLKVSSVAPEATTEALVQHINSQPRRGTVALLRSDQGSKLLEEGLKATGWKVEDVPVYSLLLDEGEDMQDVMERLDHGDVDVLVFPTPAHAQAFLVQLEERCGEDEALSLLEGSVIAAMGQETKGKLESYGIKVNLVPDKAEPSALLRKLVDHLEL
ncbi:MAG TPA: uroporphyrinogen-III synthase [Methanomassiliicoccales archaeon]|nr:uroporphyrinogen-III synthase [Methanomassiliicoccales archaeon]